MQGNANNVEKVFSTELLRALQYYAEKIDVLSLDCFGTLLWRLTATPTDAFYQLQHTQPFDALQFNASLRMYSEAKARQKKLLTQRGNEVTLNEIYREYAPDLNSEQLKALSEEELRAEKSVCHAFAPMVELMRLAHALNLKIIIVSDTYYTESQLRELLEQILPHDVSSKITRIFCSCDYGKSKINGLFADVVNTLHCKPERMLHIGDNLAADYISARALNLFALQLVTGVPYINTLLRLQTTAAKIMDPKIQTDIPLYFPHRGIFAKELFTKPETLIGYASLGPLMYSFARFLQHEIDALRREGKKPKLLFLMRDAWLPMQAYAALTGEVDGCAISISRFASYAVSFTNADDVLNYLTNFSKITRFADVAHQLLLPEKVYEPLIRIAEQHENPTAEFVRLMLRQDVLRIILSKSAEYRLRLFRYLQNEVDLKSGDTVLFIDLGYSGTTQRLLTPIFKEKGIDVLGRYLLALRTSQKESNRAGLIDYTSFDDNLLHSLVKYIALLEQLCTSNERSVIDYDKNGKPLYSDVQMSPAQHARLTLIQNECVRFIQDAKHFYSALPVSLSMPALKSTAMTELSRMIYFPTAEELHQLKEFQFDLNLGTDDVLQLFDPRKGLDGLKRRGLFFIDRHGIAKRTNYPAELRVAGFELALSFMMQTRCNLETNLSDMMLRQEPVETLLLQPHGQTATLLGAISTHDGFYAVWAPMGSGVIYQLGKRYQWLQIESAELIDADSFNQQMEAGNITDVMQKLSFQQMTNHGNGLLQCHSNMAAISMKAEESIPPNTIFRLVFRPIMIRTADVAPEMKLNTGFALSAGKVSL